MITRVKFVCRAFLTWSKNQDMKQLMTKAYVLNFYLIEACLALKFSDTNV